MRDGRCDLTDSGQRRAACGFGLRAVQLLVQVAQLLALQRDPPGCLLHPRFQPCVERLDLLEHSIESGGKNAELVIALELHPRRESSLLDLLHDVAKSPDRPGNATFEKPSKPEGNQYKCERTDTDMRTVDSAQQFPLLDWPHFHLGCRDNFPVLLQRHRQAPGHRPLSCRQIMPHGFARHQSVQGVFLEDRFRRPRVLAGCRQPSGNPVNLEQIDGHDLSPHFLYRCQFGFQPLAVAGFPEASGDFQDDSGTLLQVLVERSPGQAHFHVLRCPEEDDECADNKGKQLHPQTAMKRHSQLSPIVSTSATRGTIHRYPCLLHQATLQLRLFLDPAP